MKKRFFSMLLVICMMISLLPSMPTTIAADTESVVYDLNINLASGTKIKGFKYSDTGNVWEWHSSNPEAKGPANASAHSWGGIDTNSTAAGHWLAVKIKINEAGTYSAVLTHGQSGTQGGYGNIYLLPGDTTDVASAILLAEPVGKDIAYYNASGNVKSTTTDLSDITIEEGEEGEYILVFYASKAGSTGYRMYPDKITLTKQDTGGGEEPPAPEYSGYKATYDFTQTATDTRETTYETTKNFWRYSGVNNGWTTDADSLKKRSYGIQIQKLSLGNWAALELNVPAEGTYKVSLGHITAAQGGVGQLYIMPAETDVDSGILNSAYKLDNTVDFYSDEQTTTPTDTYLGDFTFESAGKHLLVFTYVGNSPNYTGDKNRSAYYLAYLTLDGGEDAAPMYVFAELLEEITVGTGAKVSITALMSDGSEEKMETSGFNFKVLDGTIASVDDSGYVSGVSEGTTTVFVETKDKTVSASFEVKVRAEGTAKTQFAYDFNEGLVNGEKLSTVTE